MPEPGRGPGSPFEGEVPEETRITEDREEVPGRPPVREGSPLVEPDRAPGVPDAVPPGPGSPA